MYPRLFGARRLFRRARRQLRAPGLGRVFAQPRARLELDGQLGARGRIVLVIGDAAGQALRDHPGFVGVVAHLAQRFGDMGGQRWIGGRVFIARSEEPTSELQSLMRTSYAAFCLKKKKTSS